MVGSLYKKINVIFKNIIQLLIPSGMKNINESTNIKIERDHDTTNHNS